MLARLHAWIQVIVAVISLLFQLAGPVKSGTAKHRLESGAFRAHRPFPHFSFFGAVKHYPRQG